MFIIHTIPHNEYMKLHIYATPEDGIGQQTLYELEKQRHVNTESQKFLWYLIFVDSSCFSMALEVCLHSFYFT